MLFDYDLTIPAGTTAAAPAVSSLKLTKGNITEIRVFFPPGCATLVHVVICDRLHQILPANPDGSLNYDDAIVVSHMGYELTDAPYELLAYGWAPDSMFDHTITLMFELEPAGGETWQDMLLHLFESQGVTGG
jgi:hypothetical protein